MYTQMTLLHTQFVYPVGIYYDSDLGWLLVFENG